jgi:hypothetical protein
MLYRDMPSLQQYYGMRVECHRRQNDGWLLSSYTYPDDAIMIRPETGPIELRARNLRHKVEFEA